MVSPDRSKAAGEVALFRQLAAISHATDSSQPSVDADAVFTVVTHAPLARVLFDDGAPCVSRTPQARDLLGEVLSMCSTLFLHVLYFACTVDAQLTLKPWL